MIGQISRVVAALVAVVWLAGAALAQQGQLSALARVDGAASRLWVEGDSLALDLVLSQPVPWRVRFLAGPPRLVVDFREVDFAALDRARLMAGAHGQVTDLRAGPVRGGWSRLVVAMDRPRLLDTAELRTAARGGAVAVLKLRLRPVDPASFADEAARADPPGWALPRAAVTAAPRAPRGQGPLVVVLDPGHGGIDPGAERDGKTEADLMLTFARELKEALVRAGGFQVVMTREDDSFVPLETRVAL
ncbi:MAG: N-acetylmuramoyl-L-alanine amidase, partial [Gemmobacter sp.]|nr:N-acetylmuramoyl-L-alanine amidase [Gemmobacter sp.]